MYKGFSILFIIILSIALIGTAYWGYQENQEKNSILIKAENQYQRAFHDLNFHIDALNDELGKALAVNTRKQLSPSLANVWRLSYTAQSDVSQLPLVLLPFNKTEEFLANVADFSYKIAIRDLEKEPLSEKEYNTLKTLYNNCQDIQKELSNVQEKVIDNQLRWMDVEIALALEDKQMDNTIIDGFKTINKRVEEFSEIDWGPGVNNFEDRDVDKLNKLAGKLITKEEAKEIALSFLDIKSANDIKVEDVGKDSSYQVFSVSLKGEKTVHLDITKKGGYVIWMMKYREIKDKTLSYNEALDKAKEYITKHGFDSMSLINVEEYDGSFIYNFAYLQDNVIIYPDTVSVKVALDDGEIIGYQSTDYVLNHENRIIPRDIITVTDAKTMVNPNLKISSIKLALIKNYIDEEVLTYEITGELDNNVYRIYINAQNGDEEAIQKINKRTI